MKQTCNDAIINLSGALISIFEATRYPLNEAQSITANIAAASLFDYMGEELFVQEYGNDWAERARHISQAVAANK